MKPKERADLALGEGTLKTEDRVLSGDGNENIDNLGFIVVLLAEDSFTSEKHDGSRDQCKKHVFF